MRDLLVITPTRHRPASARRLAEAIAATAQEKTVLVLAIDDDDDSCFGLKLPPTVILYRGPRRTCGAWTNRIATGIGQAYLAVASLGDDHVPETPGWDTMLLDAIGATGAGIAYGNDTLQGQNLPTAPVISSSIVAALGWMFYPGCRSLFCDNVWKDLGEGAGCLAYVPGVVIRHLHWTAGLAPQDETAAAGYANWAHDEAAYHAWQRDQMASDVAKVRALVAGQPAPPHELT